MTYSICPKCSVDDTKVSVKKTFTMILLFMLGLTGCGRSPEKQNGSIVVERSEIRIVVITNGQASDPFWSVVKNGVDAAARDMSIRVEYQAPISFDMVAMAQLIDAAVASRPQGLVVSIPDANALHDPIANAIASGIPVISINSGSDVAKQLGVLTHLGQTEYETGYKAGEKMAFAGVRQAICVNQEVGNMSLDLRCQGFADAMKMFGGNVEILSVELADPTETQQRITTVVIRNPEVNGILTLGPMGVLPALKALEEIGKLDQIKLATFDLTPEVLLAIKEGHIMFAIDQQQYLQGYLPIVLLTLYITNLNTPAYDVLRTGPGFITKENAEQITLLTQKGTR